MKRPKRNAFNLSYESKLTMNMGELVPIMCMPVVPGDKFRVKTESLVRLAPLVAPMMHRVNVFTHYFFVPNRLVWNQWEDFITKGVDGTDVPVFPKIVLDNTLETTPGSSIFDRKLFRDGSLWDYLGLPSIRQIGDTSDGYVDPSPSPNSVNVPLDFKVSALPFRAYQLIYNEYYRDQNLTDPIDFSLDSGDVKSDFYKLLTLRRRAWEKDYFTSALPWLQRGPEVTVPVQGAGGSMDVVYEPAEDSSGFQIWRTNDGSGFRQGQSYSAAFAGVSEPSGSSSKPTYLAGQLIGTSTGIGNVGPELDPNGTLKVNVDEFGVNINDLRTSSALQRWFERNARGGSRYIEQILSHFGVRSSDARLQRPQFLGGSRMPISVSEVLQTSSTDATSPQANMAGHGISAGVNNGFKHYFEEHGYVIGIMSITPRTGYQQGVPRDFMKFDNMDFYFPEFAHLSEQEIKNQELYVSSEQSYNEGTFGYTPRYAEYKYKSSESHGDFRGNLAFWHLNRIFASQPNLNTTFVECNPSNRVFATSDTEDDKFWIQIYQDVKALRLMPKYGTPML
ncbi:major capsid protein [uncultured Parabacteroides sp.]|uniref:major capsid protein n=1 Tax=uncultured Parabacteroides sp. TaxID=512312 RepID=UPI002804F059|nr:major capsid protein [uncultured Parabacteroides sp.]